MKIFKLGLITLALAGCATTNGPAPANGAGADIRDASGRTVARATLREAGGGLAVHVEATGLAAGVYGTHVHAVGQCVAPAFTSAGPHWNPTAHQHGRDNPQGPHLGDLPNLVVDADGKGAVDFTIADASLSGSANPLLDADGAAVVVHAGADDYRTDPSGNSGARIACGLVARG